jgi:hypothetical protein
VQVFRQFAVEVLSEAVESAPVVDILNLLERYEYIDSVQRWQEIREICNQVTHEYRLNAEELIATLQIAFGMVTEMEQIIAALRERFEKNAGG